jgi:membrane protease YdiL (CAAX protease family)
MEKADFRTNFINLRSRKQILSTARRSPVKMPWARCLILWQNMILVFGLRPSGRGGASSVKPRIRSGDVGQTEFP